MPFYGPVVKIGTATPIKVGGTPTAGASLLASAQDHAHPLTETSGPTNLSLTTWRDTEILYRSSGNILGKRLQWFHITSTLGTTSTTLQTLGSVALARAGTYIFELIGTPYNSVVNTGVMLGFNYTGATSDRNLQVYRPNAGGKFTTLGTTAFNTKVGVAGDGYSTGDNFYMHAWGYFVATASGTFSLLYCSGTSGNNVGFDTGTMWGIRESG